MSYSVIFRYVETGDNYVTLAKPTIGELQSKIPMYHNTIKTHHVSFKDQTGVDIADNEDLQNAFDAFGRQNLIIKVIYAKKEKMTRSASHDRYNRNQSQDRRNINRNKPQQRRGGRITTAPRDNVCHEFRNSGRCRRGHNCRFVHPPRNVPPQQHSGGRFTQQKICNDFANTGQCKFGANCRLLHQRPNIPPQFRPQTVNICSQFRNTGRCRFGSNCRLSHQIPPNMPHGQTMGGPRRIPPPNASQPVRPSNMSICTNFKNSGQCKFGHNCRFSHQIRAPRPPPQPLHVNPRNPAQLPNVKICTNFQSNGQCQYGNKCRFSHQMSGPSQSVQPGAPNTRICTNYQNNGQCKFGQQCHFSHEISANIAPKTDICTHFQKGHCPFGGKCKFKHIQTTSTISHKSQLTVLPYRWQKKSQIMELPNPTNTDEISYQLEGAVSDTKPKDIGDEWIWCSYNDSKQYEQQFNDTNATLPNEFEALNRFRRISTFEGKVMKIQSGSICFVEPNYTQENPSTGIPFFYSSMCPDVKKGCIIQYTLQFFTKPKRGYRAVDINIISRPECDDSSSDSAKSTPGETKDSTECDDSSKRYMDKVHQLDKAKGVGYIWSSKLRTLIEFDLNECTHIDIEKDDTIEYNVIDDKAVNITALILDYKWKLWNDKLRRWQQCAYQQCIEYENTYNKNHLNIETELNLDNKRMKRYTRFQGKIKRLSDDKSKGWVQCGQNSILFESDQCNFNMKMLSDGDMISYEIDIDKIEENKDGVIITRHKCVDVKYLPIRYVWQYKELKGDAEDEWTNCDVSTSKQMDRNHFQRYKQSKYQDIIEGGKRYKRIVEFTGTIIQRAQDDVNGVINVDFDDNYCNIGIKYESIECKKQFQLYDQVQFKIINTDGGMVKAVNISKPGESKRKRGSIIRMDKQKKTGYIRSHSDDKEEKNNEYTFSFADCNGFDIFYIPLGTQIEYELKYQSRPKPSYKAVKICLYLLQYQWVTYDSANNVWKQHNMDESLQFDAEYNNENKIDGSKVRVTHDKMRITKFQRKVTDLRARDGLIEVNKGLCIRFEFKDLQFDAKYLSKGDDVIYELKKINGVRPQWKVVNIEFARFIPFYWMKCVSNIGIRIQKGKWINVPYGQNMSLERKFNPNKDVPFGKVMTDVNARKKYRRHTIFRGKVVRLCTDNESGKMSLFYHRDFRGLLVDFDNKDLEKNHEYKFEIVANDCGLTGFKAINIKTNFEKRIFIQSYSSKLMEIDAINKTGKLEIPTNLSQFIDLKKEIWHYQNDEYVYVAFPKSICDQIDTVNIGEVVSYSLDGNQYITQKVSTQSALQTNVATGFKRTLKKQISAEKESPKSISFTFVDCKGFNAEKLKNDCILEYNVMINGNYDDDMKGDEDDIDVFPFVAIKVRIPMISYRWQMYDSVNTKWKAETRENSIKYEKKYRNEHKSDDSVINGENDEKLHRIIRFRGKILKIEAGSKRGQVRINYSKEYGKDIGVWFDFRECRFNPYYLKKGDDVEYNLSGHKAVNVRLWLIPFRWKYKVNDDDNTGKYKEEEWCDFTYHECREMESKYNAQGGNDDDDFKDIVVPHNGKSVTAQRKTKFRARCVFDPRNRNQCSLNIIYSRSRKLGIRISYIFSDGNPGNIRPYNWVQFELKRGLLKRNWSVCNLEKVKYENKSAILVEKQRKELEDLQSKGDDDSYNLYKPDISAAFNQLKMNRSMTFSSKEWKYTITKVGDDIGTQMNDKTQTQREVKRFKATTAHLSIPDTEYYEETFDKLSDIEIKKLFYKTADASFVIDEIEDVMDNAQSFQYEVNLWKRCDQLSKARQNVEKYLWHGTSYDVSNIIIQNGFDRDYSTVAAYGKGTYFAVNARYSVNGYCDVHSDGFQYILLCKVIVGDSTVGSGSMHRVPLKPDGTEYDTLVDTANDATIYVVWRDFRALPMYRVKFKKQ